MSTTGELEIIQAESRGRIAILRVRGRLEAETVPALLDRCAAIQANGQNLVLNLSQVSFLASSGVGALLVLVEQFQEQAGAVRFAEPSEAVRGVIDLLDLGQYLAIDASEDAAVAGLGA